MDKINIIDNGPLTQMVLSKGIFDFHTLLNHVRALPYGRNQNRYDLSLVLQENQGTCSSKHAFIKSVADELDLGFVKLILVMYKMHIRNTPGIGDHISQAELEYIPEAHCVLLINDQYVDITNAHSSINRIEQDILLTKEIESNQVNKFKVDFHQSYIKNWIEHNQIGKSFVDIWKTRERCIYALSKG